jgi:hypothetical protein
LVMRSTSISILRFTDSPKVYVTVVTCTVGADDEAEMKVAATDEATSVTALYVTKWVASEWVRISRAPGHHCCPEGLESPLPPVNGVSLTRRSGSAPGDGYMRRRAAD